MSEQLGLIHMGMSPEFTSRVHVFLDGADITPSKVFAADDRQGWAVRLCLDEHGRAHLGANGLLRTEIVTGDVRIEVQA